MKILYVFALLIVAAVAFALPVEEHHRERRVTCDLLDGLGVGHSACAAHCLAKGYKGGSCTSNGICSCRKDRWIG
ncbi:PREDICTED: sapecin-C [Wasmannia auropunctata]|uniref:sapecin-C n=1 Tax=Wasmannia auropunctata TaxID=64793 RepID=UPI0005ED88C4|nr:PREDICTED: sapecin-C [Wasmannia auropunctata]